MTDVPSSSEQWVKSPAVANHFRVTQATISQWRKSHRIPPHAVRRITSKTILYDLPAIINALEPQIDIPSAHAN